MAWTDERAKAEARADAAEARLSSARDEGLEMAAAWHDAEAERIRVLALSSDTPHRYHEAQDDHITHAAFIRALKAPTEGTKP